MMMVLTPILAAAMAAQVPAGPPPTTSKSQSYASGTPFPAVSDAEMSEEFPLQEDSDGANAAAAAITPLFLRKSLLSISS